MLALYIIAVITVVLQFFFVLHVYRNYRYVIKKAFRKQRVYHPPTALIVPCKGLDTEFEKNITSFYNLDYDRFELIFVTESRTDPAYASLERLREELQAAGKAFNVRILVAGIADSGSQKLHNLLYACENISEGIEVLAFADSDACLRRDWIWQIVYPLRKSGCGVSSGYRWYVPSRNNLATLVLSAVNAKIAQNLGASRFNQAWGGSMAVRVEVFDRLGIRQIWKKAVSDDLTLSRAVKAAGMKVVFVPACLVASYEQMSWMQFFEFARRQFLITRITTPGAWWFAVFGSFYSVFGLWGLGAIAAVLAGTGLGRWYVFAIGAVIFYICQTVRAVLRQRMITRILSEDAKRLRVAAWTDILGNSLLSWVLFICVMLSAAGRTITWRGVKYRLLSPTEIVRVGRGQNTGNP